MNFNYRDYPSEDNRLSKPLNTKRRKIIIAVAEHTREVRQQLFNLSGLKRKCYGLGLDHEKECDINDSYFTEYAKKMNEVISQMQNLTDELVSINQNQI